MQNDIKNVNNKNSSKFSITQPVKGDDNKSEIIENKKYMLTVHFHLLCTGNIRATIFEDNGRISKRVRPIPTRVVPYNGIVPCIVNLLQQLALCYVCNGTIFRISGDIPQLKQIILTHKNYIFWRTQHYDQTQQIFRNRNRSFRESDV